MYPAWGFIFAYMVELLYTPFSCFEPDGCQEERQEVTDDMKELARNICYASVATIVITLVGNVMLFYGFGKATAKMNKRVRDEAFQSLVRQEVGFFDLRPHGTLAAQLQDDAALIHSFSGEPIRTLILNVSSVLVGLVIGFIYMWCVVLSISMLFFSICESNTSFQGLLRFCSASYCRSWDLVLKWKCECT